MAFLGTGVGGQQGIYRFVPPNPTRVADLSTPIPNGTGNFTSIPTDPSISGSQVVFIGSGPNVGDAGQEGVYFANTIPVPPPIMPIADTITEVPGGFGNFTRFLPTPPPIIPIADRATRPSRAGREPFSS